MRPPRHEIGRPAGSGRLAGGQEVRADRLDAEAGGGTISDGLNRKENHDKIEKQLREGIEQAAAAGVPNVITLSGNRARAVRRGRPGELRRRA